MKKSYSIEKSNVSYTFADVAANAASQEVIDLSPFSGNITFQVVTDGILTADSTVTVEESNDGVNYVTASDNAGADLTIALAAGVNNIMKKIHSDHARYLRLSFSEGTNTAGTVSMILFVRHK